MRIRDLNNDRQAAMWVYHDIIFKELDPCELEDFDLDYVTLRLEIAKQYCNEMIKICKQALEEENNVK